MIMERRIFVFFDGEQVPQPVLMGVLTAANLRGKEVFSFEFDRSWLAERSLRSFDPDLQLYAGRQYVPAAKDNFGLFLDSAPDRWGRVLLERREAMLAREEHRPERKLFETDYLLDVFDGSRMGALRFKTDLSGDFLDNDSRYATPPWTSLRELENASLCLEGSPEVEQSRWLRMLVAPGSSLGGARPKASVLDADGNLWIAKFPSRKDRIDVGAWEAVCMELAAMAGIQVSEHRTEKFNSGYHTFLTRRFDRTVQGRRRQFTSAMTLLGYGDGERSEGASYLEIAQWIQGNCVDVQQNLSQLFRRIAFNVAVSNCDDHLRNHGFLYTAKGWTLSPAYDLTPDPLGTGLKLNISETDNALDMDLVRSVAPYFRIDGNTAGQVIGSVLEAVSDWRRVASRLGIPRDEQERMRPAFGVLRDWDA